MEFRTAKAERRLIYIFQNATQKWVAFFLSISHTFLDLTKGVMHQRNFKLIFQCSMAVWMQIIGIRQSKSKEFDKEKISKILDILRNEYLDFSWTLENTKGIDFFQVQLRDQKLIIYFDNSDFIEFSGYALFNNWFDFADKKNSESTNQTRTIFRKISYNYGISELIYFSEWFFELNEIRNEQESFEDLMVKIKSYPNLNKDQLYDLQSNEYFIEKLDSKSF